MNIIFMGTPEIAAFCLNKIHSEFGVTAVVTAVDKPAGRGKKIVSPAVIEFARSRKISFVQTENVNRCEEFFSLAKDIDVIVVLAFAQFLGKKILNLPKIGCFNIHTSLLPKYRGAAPIQYALLNGDRETGVSIQKMVKKMDAGDICYSHPVVIRENESGGQLYTRLKFQAALAMNEFIYHLVEDRVTYTPQDEQLVSFAPVITKEMGHLKFAEENFTTLTNKIRAFDPWPGTFCFLNGKRLKVFSIDKVQQKLSRGEVSVEGNQLVIGAKECSVRLKDVQLAGKKRCSDSELLNGLRNTTTDWIIS
jgi:methionyl-tRNA formyltransferase